VGIGENVEVPEEAEDVMNAEHDVPISLDD
jgi:hypothetical protein